MKRDFFCILLLCLANLVFAQANTTTITQAETQSTQILFQKELPSDPAILLGKTPKELIELFGAPERVYAVRGIEAWQDDVVFDYNTGFSFFLFEDRVWQIRISNEYKKPILGFTITADQERISAVIGSADLDLGDSIEWILPGEAWPVRIRVNFTDTRKANELYIYRGDF